MALIRRREANTWLATGVINIANIMRRVNPARRQLAAGAIQLLISRLRLAISWPDSAARLTVERLWLTSGRRLIVYCYWPTTTMAAAAALVVASTATATATKTTGRPQDDSSGRQL